MSAKVQINVIAPGSGHFSNWRKQLEKSQAEMADALGVSLATYQKAEGAKKGLSAKDHVAIVTGFQKLGFTTAPIETKTA